MDALIDRLTNAVPFATLAAIVISHLLLSLKLTKFGRYVAQNYVAKTDLPLLAVTDRSDRTVPHLAKRR